MMNDDCPLCRRLRGRSAEWLAQSRVTALSPGPFFAQWPGALMLVSRRHVREQTDLRPIDARETYLDLLDAERALRRITGCDRVNVVKFGNVTPHLHWHLIPRYLEERYGRLTSWEVEQLHPELKASEAPARSESVYALPRAQWSSQGLLVGREDLLSRLTEDFLSHRAARPHAIFGAALFFRPALADARPAAATLTLDQTLAAVRGSPQEWESLLMQRNYLDRTWDNVGGNGEAGEFPEAIMRREVSEELGWDLGHAQEACRQWTSGLLRGFLYAAKPKAGGTFWMADDPERTPCDEVADLRFLNVAAIAQGNAGVALSFSVRERHAALIEGRLDFSSTVR